MPDLVQLITAADPARRNQALAAACAGLSAGDLLDQCARLDDFRRRSENLYERVRALFFLYAIHRFHLPERLASAAAPAGRRSLIPFAGYEHLLQRRFEEALDQFLAVQQAEGPSDAISSALAAAYHRLGFQTLADQVRRSVRSVRGNQWMFRMGHPADHPLRLRPELCQPHPGDGTYPILRECTPVRMDLTHCGWSDIFFLGMDYPEGAKVLNVSIDLGVHGRDPAPRPPVEASLRVIEEPLLRLASLDLGAAADITNLAEVFDFAKDYLGLLKAAVIAAGLVPPGIEGSGQSLAELLARLAGRGRGLEIVSRVNNIPKGSRLAVSTTLLAALVSVCMRATGQAASLTGPLQEHERRLVLARALLGEWLGGSGGGWQDSGGVWPGMKLIEGVPAGEGDPEFGVSRGRLMPRHRILAAADAALETRRRLQESLVLVHGGMAQNVGPILEMVTEKYLLRCADEWQARQSMLGILDEILAALRAGDVRRIGAATTRNFQQPIQTIIPWATNYFTESLIQQVRAEFGPAFWGFWMLGGMSGGGMGFIFAPEQKARAQTHLQELMSAGKRALQHALPFAMEPVVYDFAINERGTEAVLLEGAAALMPPAYYTLLGPALLRQERHTLTPARRAEWDQFGAACRARPEWRGVAQTLFEIMLPRGQPEAAAGQSLAALLEQHGFDRLQHEQIRADLKEGRIGLAQNRLPASAVIEDAPAAEVADLSAPGPAAARWAERGRAALRNGELAVVTLAAGAGSRWTQGAGVVKALHPFCRLAGRHRTFIETHLAKSRRAARQAGCALPHLITTSYLTHAPIAEFLARQHHYGYEGPLHLSPGRAVGLRLVPTVRDLRFMWEEMPQQLLDEQQQKVRDSLRQALIHWAAAAGEASDYTDNLPLQCLHPVGHWYEVPNLLRNGVLARLLAERPGLQYLLLHNIDTLGADADPALLGWHIDHGACLTFEVIPRRLEDRGGGLARVNGQLRLVEGLALPREEAEFALTYYNSNTCWIHLDKLLAVFRLTRADLADAPRVAAAIRSLAARMPTYITLKEVKKRWGHGQEDIFPVTQFEKLWVDLTALPEVDARFVAVPRLRGQQLKDPAQLDGWLRDGSAAYVERLCDYPA
ncbi:MAG: UTP--glucose-1-phosphate uridylyltransferase [Verrucomicrobia bacterium]|nr:UTP--glucose-1-phosphate uridylyltransferase [Verrucomicrobiota bacterium]HRY57352.1 UTP--glucose-1-phosphate uridylyltransferase [Candidatus Paceibacterota bacterium]NLH85011.1 UTP--glucose-1-phosphate uridylyltransferase [Verrucomicrobiota bacterium]HOS75329.1 UTP--glucose-1-phosphate uridylyltransferase [Verrucomicrobiota bacterium]HQE89681.1 UTP--glucose-1-phosphate uridylyltransferase [Verrucomicrobiota bacterium]